MLNVTKTSLTWTVLATYQDVRIIYIYIYIYIYIQVVASRAISDM